MNKLTIINLSASSADPPKEADNLQTNYKYKIQNTQFEE